MAILNKDTTIGDIRVLDALSGSDNTRYTSFTSLSAKTGSYRVYASSDAPRGSYSTWAVTQFEAAASTDNPSTKYFIQIAMLGNSDLVTDSDLWYRKCSHNGTSWNYGASWRKIFANNGDISFSNTARTLATVTNSTSKGYFRNIKVGTSAPSTLTSGEVFLVYEP